MDDGLQLMIGSGALGALCGVASAWIKARFSRTKVEPQPLEVEHAPKYVTCEQCDLRHKAVENRLDRYEADVRAINDTLQKMRHEEEDRAKRLHDRLDPVVQAVAANQELLKQHLEDHRVERARQ